MEKIFVKMQRIVDRIKKHEEETDLRGENYNIFNVLGLTSNETRLHSAFIANLLDPKAKHGLKTIPIREFLKIIGIDDLKSLSDEDLRSARVRVEHRIGPINREYTEGGNIDIYVKVKDLHIVMENKIYAGDQTAQLLRYKNFIRNHKHKLLYLTLDGHSPAAESHGNLVEGKDFFCISYENEITNWLQECLHSSISMPLIRETLQQYKNVINQLTNPNMKTEDLKDLFKIMADHHEVVETIYKNQRVYYDYLFENFIIGPMKDDLAKRGLRYKIGHKEYESSSSPYGISFYSDEWSNKAIRIEYEAKPFLETIIGICWSKKTKKSKENLTKMIA